MPMFEMLLSVRNELDDESEMVGQAHIGELLVEWTNPENAM
jgi:condensin complex subunit 3